MRFHCYIFEFEIKFYKIDFIKLIIKLIISKFSNEKNYF